jgi:hypothetical protein
MRERFDTPFRPGQGEGEGVEEVLKGLEVAGVELTIEGKTYKSAELLKAGDYDAVLVALRPRRAALTDPAQLNDLGCAEAWAHKWDAATDALRRSGCAAADKQGRERAQKNLELVEQAKELGPE